MAISREKIKKIVEVFYQPTFKTFYVNSVDGENFVKPLGIFVSLGLTTPLQKLNEIKEVIGSDSNLSSTLAIISSKKIGGQFLNTLVETTNPEQFDTEGIPDDILKEEDARKELDELSSHLNVSEEVAILQECAPKISKLRDLIEKITRINGWDINYIQRDPEEGYKIYHAKVNYKKVDDIEYRVGIYVSETN